MADDFKQFYEKAPELAFTTAALKNEVEMSKLDSEKHDKFAAHIADKVSARLELWIQSINDLQKRVVAREQARSIYLHYHSKIAEIRIDHEKLLASGKAESSSDTERRLRVRSTDAL